MHRPLENRYDFVLFFDVTDGNPNGDPDAGNRPRVDPETSQGLVSDVCLKRKIRNYIDETLGDGEGVKIYVKENAILNSLHRKAYQVLGVEWSPKKLPQDQTKAWQLTQWMCTNYFDIRTFGAVMTTDVNAGQVRGPVQLSFARSLDPIYPSEVSITRCAVTNERDDDKRRTMGRKYIVPYGLYRCYGFISATLAEKTGFSEDDLSLFKAALNGMFDTDRASARGLMSPVRCIAFKHQTKIGNARADVLFNLVQAGLKKELDGGNYSPRSRNDYVIELCGVVPKGVSVEEWIR